MVLLVHQGGGGGGDVCGTRSCFMGGVEAERGLLGKGVL